MKAYGRGSIVCCEDHTKYGKGSRGRSNKRRLGCKGAKKRARQADKQLINGGEDD